MALYLETESGFVPYGGGPVDGVIPPGNAEALWSDADLAELDLYRPDAADPVPAGKVSVGVAVERVEDVVKYVLILQDAPPPSPSDVDREHDRRASIGRTFTVADYGDVALEGSLRTQTVLLALKDTARDLVAAGVTAPVLFLTDRDNVDHYLTPAQMIELVNAGKGYMQALHEAKRAIKALEPIPADYADDARWP